MKRRISLVYLNVLTDIIDSGFTADGYAFLADQDGQIINHPNPAYQPWNDGFVNLSTLSYAEVYNGDSGSIGDFTARRQASLMADRSDHYVFAPDADILIVDDNEMNLRVAAGLMKRNGFVPDTADSGRACIERVAKRHYDIIFVDHMMPEMDGIETLHALTSGGLLSGDTAVIAMTANAIVEAREEYLQAGFTDYLSKPIIVKKLEAALEKYLPKEKVSYKQKEPEQSPSPDGIGGEDIPVYVRIIGVADAYDAMTSKRSYRGVLPQDVVKNESEKGSGTQFDPVFAKIMMDMIEEDRDYEMHE